MTASRSRSSAAKPRPAPASLPVDSSGRIVFSDEDLLYGVFLLCMFLLCIFPLADTDFWWHLKTGQLIWERGTVPATDWYLFTDHDRRWIDLHWGFQLLLAGSYQLGGVNLIILLKALCLTAVVAIGWSTAGKGLPTFVRTLLWVPALICISGRGYERPELFSQLFLVSWLWILSRAETQPRWLWLLPLIQVIWINVHALFVLGLIVGGAAGVDLLLRQFARGTSGLSPVHLFDAPTPAQPRWRCTPRSLVVIVVLCMLAAFCNPYLAAGASFPLVLYRKFSVEQGFYATRIGEFQQPLEFLSKNGFVSLYLNVELVLAALALLSFLGPLVLRRWSPYRLLLMFAFGHLALEASRNVNIFAIVATVVLVANVAETWNGLVSAPQADDSGPEWQRWGNLLASGLCGVWIFLIVTSTWDYLGGEKKPFGLGERPYWFVHDAARFAGRPDFPERAFVAHIGQAAVYTYHNGPERKVYMDPRLEVATQATFAAWEEILRQMSTGDRTWEADLRDARGELPVVILDSRHSRPVINGLMVSPQWRLVHADPAAAVFLETPVADRLRLPMVDPSPLILPP